VLAGTAAGGHLRLEGVAPFGSPIFVLAVSNERASLLLPRERRLLRDASAVDVLDALVGLPLSAADMQALLTGCVVANPAPSNGRAIDDAWLAVDLGGSRTAFLTRSPSGWRIAAARLDTFDVAYEAFEGRSPREIRLVTSRAHDDDVRLALRLAQVEQNVDLPVEAFEIGDAGQADPLTLDELRARGIGVSSR
jgi:hypothetical protein